MTTPRCSHGFINDQRVSGHCPLCLLAGNESPTGPKLILRELPPLAELAVEFPAYQLVKFRGRGGMGAVIEARHLDLDRPVAIKLLLPDVEADPDFEERFRREGRILARLDHPRIVRIFDFGRSAGGWCFLVMELVEGVDMAQLIKQKGFDVSMALRVVVQLSEALQYAHDAGVVHRDIKPSNVLLTRSGQVKVADFGLVKLMDEDASRSDLTTDGQRMGTPHYVAPEQLRGEPDVDHRADIYSLGVLFYELLTGQLPLGVFPPPSAKAGVDTRLDAIVLKAMNERREARYQAASEVGAAVTSVGLKPLPPIAKPTPWKLMAALFLLALLAVGVVHWQFSQKPSLSLRAVSTSEFTPARQQEMLTALFLANPGSQALTPETKRSHYPTISNDSGRWRLTLNDPFIKTLEPLRGWPLTILILTGSGVTDFSPLRDCPVQNLLLQSDLPMDFTQFGQLGLEELVIASKQLKDLRGALSPTLKGLHVSGTGIATLDAVRDCPQLSNLSISNTAVADLEPIRTLGIASLNAEGTRITSIEPLRGRAVHGINLRGSPIKDFTPLLGAKHLSLQCDEGKFDQAGLEAMLKQKRNQ